ncbi:MAG: hypothetical protein ACE5EX_04785 [Phycisphaerae bacterium]
MDTETSQAAAGSNDYLEIDLTCTQCGYNLRGLTHDRKCPECGTPVGQSLQGNLLRFADPTWLASLRRGSRLMLWFIVSAVIGGCTFNTMGVASAPHGIGLIVSLIGPALLLAAIVLVTTPEPSISTADHTRRLGTFVRVSALVQLLGRVGLFQTWLVDFVPMGLTQATTILAGAAAHLGLLIHIRRLTPRIPDSSLAKRTTVVIWGYVSLLGLIALVAALLSWAPSSTGGAVPGGGTAALGGFGALAFLMLGVLYVSLIVRYHRAFKTAEAESRRIAEVFCTPS